MTIENSEQGNLSAAQPHTNCYVPNELATRLGIAPQWAQVLGDPALGLESLVGKFYADPTAHTLPERSNVLRAFAIAPQDVKVVIVGQDPYPTPGDAVGLSFAVGPHARTPRSLANIYKEYASDLALPIPNHGDLSAWEAQGVMLLNRVLTVEAGAAGSHRGQGWEAITLAAITHLVAVNPQAVAILWGKDAQTLSPLFGPERSISSVHPSPLSARRGFFGSRPFSSANALLEAHGIAPVDWEIPLAPLGQDQGEPTTLF